MVTSLDRAVGAVLDALERTGQERDTLVVFSSDNGGERFSYQWPLRDSKGALYEGGIRRTSCAGRAPSAGAGLDLPIFTADGPRLLDIGGAAPSPRIRSTASSPVPARGVEPGLATSLAHARQARSVAATGSTLEHRRG